ncbi:MAG: zinc-ribbon domain-containing protein [Deltaproteobacteria bacterium]|nr:zinc-ribbon domain-containing protein [Deltaproteobacteria bacterium]
MIVACKKCGKKYQVDPEHLNKGITQFQCESCKSVITIPKEGKNPTKDASSETAGTAPPPSGARRRGIGLRGKMFFLFFFVPICLFVAASLFYLDHMKTLSGLITQESSQVVTKMAEQAIAEKGRTVANEIERYIVSHPELAKNPPFPKEDYKNYPEFQSIAIQKVGQTGYTCLVAKHTESEPISKLWAHPIENLIGVDIDAAMKKTLGEDFQRWYDITVNAFKGKGQEAAGYYMWYDKREKYMVMVPVEGTDFFIASTTYLDEFTLPMTELEKRAIAMTSHARRTVMLILIATALLVALFVVVYGYRLSGRLKGLSDAADRISVGNLDVNIGESKAGDEIGDLANALDRMQTSIRLAIKRLRERK